MSNQNQKTGCRNEEFDRIGNQDSQLNLLLVLQIGGIKQIQRLKTF